MKEGTVTLSLEEYNQIMKTFIFGDMVKMNYINSAELYYNETELYFGMNSAQTLIKEFFPELYDARLKQLKEQKEKEREENDDNV